MENSTQTKQPVSIVIPVYNEEQILERTIREHHSEIIEQLPGSEMIVVDDCSTDNSPVILKKLQSELSNIYVLRPKQNGGHGRALRLGLENVKNDLIFHTDSDYQNNPKDFWKLYQAIKSCDLVIGYRAVRHDPLYRLLLTRVVRLANILLFGLNLRDANSPFKIIRKEPMTQCLELIKPDAFAPSIMLAITAKKLGYKVSELPVEHFPRKTGRVTIANLKIIKVSLRGLSEILDLKRTLSKSS